MLRASSILDKRSLVKFAPAIIYKHPCSTVLHDSLRSRLRSSRLRWSIVARKLNTRQTLPGQGFAGDNLDVPVLHDTFMPHGASVLHNYPRSRLRSSKILTYPCSTIHLFPTVHPCSTIIHAPGYAHQGCAGVLLRASSTLDKRTLVKVSPAIILTCPCSMIHSCPTVHPCSTIIHAPGYAHR